MRDTKALVSMEGGVVCLGQLDRVYSVELLICVGRCVVLLLTSASAIIDVSRSAPSMMSYPSQGSSTLSDMRGTSSTMSGVRDLVNRTQYIKSSPKDDPSSLYTIQYTITHWSKEYMTH